MIIIMYELILNKHNCENIVMMIINIINTSLSMMYEPQTSNRIPKKNSWFLLSVDSVAKEVTFEFLSPFA